MSNKNYNRDEILARLSRIRGVNLKPNNYKPTYVEASKYAEMGIKVLGMIDFLGLKVVRVAMHKRGDKSRRRR